MGQSAPSDNEATTSPVCCAQHDGAIVGWLVGDRDRLYDPALIDERTA